MTVSSRCRCWVKGVFARSVTLKLKTLPFLRSLSNCIRAVVLISVSENDTVGIRIASGCTHTDSKPVVIHGWLHSNDYEEKITFEISKKLLSPVLIYDQ